MSDNQILEANIENVKQYWNARPCNVRHSPLEKGTKEYFDQVEQRKYFVEPHIPGFAEFDKWKDKKVLEVGCGIGTDAVNFARAGAHYTGVDLSIESLNLAKKRFEVFGLRGDFHNANGEELANLFEHQSFDLIYSFGVIHHTPSPEAVIANIRKLIAPAGELRIMLYAKNSWKNVMMSAGLDQPEAQSGCPIAFTYSHEDVHKLLEGFEVKSIKQDHIFPYQIESYIKYKYVKQPWFAAMPEELWNALEKNLGWHLCITASPSA